MRYLFSRIPTVVWLGPLVLVLTLLPGGIWTVLLVANLSTSPTIPWAVVVMALMLWLMWQYLGGKWWPRSTSQARRRCLRARPVAGPVFAWAVVAGVLSIVALTGFWIVLFQLVKVQGNPLPDFSQYPAITVALVIGMASLVGAVSEEAGFRGYFQGLLEKRVGGPLAILLAALVIAPGHGLTQGFAWPTVLFYLFVDAMFGMTAYLTNSILPSLLVHFIGLITFFTLVWPNDATRQLVGEGGAELWFWIHVAQALIFTALAILAFRRLARVTDHMRKMKPLAERPRKKGIRRIVVGMLAIVFGLAFVSVLAVVLATFIQYRRNDHPIALPTPRGPHPVGRMLMDWTDARRNREIMVFLWYPAQEGASGQKCEYIPGTWGELEADKMLPIPAKRYREIQVSAIADAPLASGSIPVLVLLPGMGRIPAHYTTLAEDLASYGYLIVGVTPTGSSSVVVFSDGHTVHGREFDPDTDGPIKTQEYIETWRGDASFALDQLSVDSHFANRIDLNKVGVLGHSFGGSVAVQALQLDARFSRGAVLDSGFFGDPIKSFDRPLAILAADSQIEPEWKALCDSDSATCTTHLFPRARHMNFSDAAMLPSRFPLPKSLLMLGDVDGAQFLHEVSDLLRDFFDQM